MDDSLLRLLPPVTRARGWRLYTDQGTRLVDFWQYGGRAILGHNPPGLLRAFKNSAERGLFAPLPHAAEQRLIKALCLILPGRRFRLYRDEASLRAAIQFLGPFTDTALAAAGATEKASLWRPWLETPDSAIQSTAFLVPVLPLPLSGAPFVLALDPPLESQFPPSELLSPALLAAAARSIYDLLAAPRRPRFPKTDQALKASHCWKRRGIYLSCTAEMETGETYTRLFRRFLEAGFLLPPVPQQPAILPGELSPGEDAALAVVLKSCEIT